MLAEDKNSLMSMGKFVVGGFILMGLLIILANVLV